MNLTNEKYNTLAAFLRSIGYETVDDQFVIHKLQEVTPPAPYRSAVFRANYFTFVLLKSGNSKYTLDQETYSVKPKTLYFTNPGHLKSFEMLEEVDGYLISFSEQFLKQYIEADIYSLFPYLLSEVVPPQYLADTLFAELWSLAQQVQEEHQRKSKFSEMMIASYFKIFLLKINERLYSNYDPIEDGDRNSEIVRRFKVNLEKHLQDLLARKVQQIYQVADFADLQHLHPGYFSSVIKTKTGKTVSEWISEKIVLEAQSQLVKTNKPIKQIAFQLGFNEANYFSKYFKKATGVTPGAYRKAQS